MQSNVLKYLVWGLTIIVFSGCRDKEGTGNNSVAAGKENSGEAKMEDTSVVEPLAAASAGISTDSQRITLPELEVLSATDSFLLNPFDLQAFKRKEEANSGHEKKRPYYFKPGYRGVYYRFFMYWRNQGFERNDLQIVTYKPDGKYQYDYLDPTEELIEVKSSSNHRSLPELAFVGKTSSQVTAQLGAPFWMNDSHMAYVYKDRVLALGLSDSRVKWQRYAHLNKIVTKPEQLPVEVLEYKVW